MKSSEGDVRWFDARLMKVVSRRSFLFFLWANKKPALKKWFGRSFFLVVLCFSFGVNMMTLKFTQERICFFPLEFECCQALVRRKRRLEWILFKSLFPHLNQFFSPPMVLVVSDDGIIIIIIIIIS